MQQQIMASHSNYPSGPYEVGKHIIPPSRPISPATASYQLNHLMLRIKDVQRSLRFYCDCLGMHVVFIFNAGPWTIYYLGPRDVGTCCNLMSPPLPPPRSHWYTDPHKTMVKTWLVWEHQKAYWNCIISHQMLLRHTLPVTTIPYPAAWASDT